MPCRKAKARATEQTVNASLAPEHFGKRLRNKAKAKAQQFQCALSISDGRTTVGAVARCGARQVATDADGTTVGNFATPTGEQGRLTEADLRKLYPAAFSDQRLPLKIGIHVDTRAICPHRRLTPPRRATLPNSGKTKGGRYDS